MTTAAETRSYAAQLTRDTLIEMYRVMVLSRRLDERAWALHRQGKIAFHISAIGHEACQVAAATRSTAAWTTCSPTTAI